MKNTQKLEEQAQFLKDENIKLKENVEEFEQENRILRSKLSDGCLIEEKLDKVIGDLAS